MPKKKKQNQNKGGNVGEKVYDPEELRQVGKMEAVFGSGYD